MAHEPRTRIALPGRKASGKGAARAAVIVLEGSSVEDLRLAIAAALPFHPRPLLIAVDGGLSTCRAIGHRPDLFVGDLDSARVAPRDAPARIYPVEKDFSDFAGALVEARGLGADVVVVAGLFGGRLDHEWANLLEAGAAAPAYAGILAPSARGLVLVTARGARVECGGRCLVSVFAIGGAATVSLSGTSWTLARKRLRPGSLGLSNVADDHVVLEVHAGAAALVFPRLDLPGPGQSGSTSSRKRKTSNAIRARSRRTVP